MHHIQFASAAASSEGGGGIAPMIVMLVIAVFFIACQWKIFTKAGKPGWACIIPIYGTIVFLDIAGKPAWWFILFLIPIVSLVISLLTLISFCQAFGKGAGFAIGMIFLPFIFLPMLAFGSAQYQGAPR
jgi:hypothetical protein